MKIRLLLAASAAALVVSSCGGGGGGSNSGGGSTPTPPPPPPPPANNAPAFTTNFPTSTPENSVNAYTETATDADGDAISFTISGTDASLMFLDSGTGEVIFRDAPDFENPEDGDADNIYEFTITASDGEDQTTVDRQLQVTNEFDTVAVLPVPREINSSGSSFRPNLFVLATGDANADGSNDIFIGASGNPVTSSDGTQIIVDGRRLASLDGKLVRAATDTVTGPGEDDVIWLAGDANASERLFFFGADELDGEDRSELFFRRVNTADNTAVLEMALGSDLPDFGADLQPVSDAVAGGTTFTSPGEASFALVHKVLGDVDGGGLPDILLASCRGCPNVEMVIVPGETAAAGGTVPVDDIPFTADGARLVWADSSPNSLTFQNIMSLGDLDGDGRAETVIGDPLSNTGTLFGLPQGSVLIAFGSNFDAAPSGTLNFPDDLRTTRILGEESIPGTPLVQSIGFTLRSAGDVDADGLEDLLIRSLTGVSYVIFGSAIRDSAGTTLSITDLVASGGGFSITTEIVVDLAGLGDVNGDDSSDLVLLTELAGVRTAYVISGTELLNSPDGRWTQSELLASNAMLPIIYDGVTGLIASGDLNGDDADDLLLLAPSASAGLASEIIGISSTYIGELINAGEAQIDLSAYQTAP